MRAIERNIRVDEHGFLHAWVRFSKRIRKRALRTKDIEQARRGRDDFEAELRVAERRAGVFRDDVRHEKASESSAGAELRDENAKLKEQLAAMRATIDGLSAAVKDLTYRLQTAPSNNDKAIAADRPTFARAIELHVAHLEHTITNDSTLRMYRDDALKVVLPQCKDWESFDPSKIWAARRRQLRVMHKKLLKSSGDPREPDENAGGTSLNHLKVYIRKFASWAVKKQWLPANVEMSLQDIRTLPVAAQKVNVPDPGVMEEFFQRAESVNLILGRYLRLLFLIGCRKMSIQALRWEDIDFRARTAELLVKRQRREIVPLLPEAVAYLEKIKPTESPTGPVMVLNDSQYKQALRLIKSVIKSQGQQVTKIHSLKSLRSAFTSYLLELGFSPPEIAKLLCHKDNGVLVMRVYGKITERHLRTKVAGTTLLNGKTHASTSPSSPTSRCQQNHALPER